MTLSAVWSETSLDPDNRSHYGVCTLLNNALDRAELGFIHRNGFKELPAEDCGAVVVIHGAHQATAVQQVMDGINRLTWSVIIVIGDEAAIFPVERLYGPRRKVWVQMPVPGPRHDRADRFLICGYPHDAPAFLENCKGLPRIFDWSYAGQVNHAHRKQCVEVLRSMHNGYLFESPTFWNGIPRDEYYKVLSQSKVVACPPGAATPDTLRLAEALEAGCIPVADDRWPPGYPRTGSGMNGYWRYVLGEEPPFPMIKDWREFPAVVAQVLAEGPEKADRIQSWWQGYKGRMREWLRDDVTAVMNQ